MGADSPLAVSVCILLIAGAIPPTEPGPGMFPATAAAWAAAAAWAVAACCCICLWHWRRSNTCRDSAAIKPSNRARWDEITPRTEAQLELFAMLADPCGYLDVGTGVDFVNSISRRSPRLPVQIVALNKHRVVTQASHPHVPLALTLQLNAFADVQPERGEQGDI